MNVDKMKHIQSLNINRFRGIKDLSLTKLSPITVFLGENSVGKSTVLEALFMTTGPNNPFMPLRITSMRAHGALNIKDVNYMFYDCDFTKTPSLEATFYDNEKRKLSIYPSYSFDERADALNISSIGNSNGFLTELNCKFDIINDNLKYSGESSIVRNSEGKWTSQFDSNYIEQIRSISLSPYNMLNSLSVEYSELIKEGKKEVILKALRNFDNRISKIEATNDGLYIGYNHLENLVPLNMAGDGIQKYLGIAVYAYHPSINIVFIDEIENGLHFLAHKKLWDCILETARTLHKQFFISTHNQETLKCLSTIVGDSDDLNNLINIVTLSRNDDKIAPYYLSGSGFYGAMEDEVEIRK